MKLFVAIDKFVKNAYKCNFLTVNNQIVRMRKLYDPVHLKYIYPVTNKVELSDELSKNAQ